MIKEYIVKITNDVQHDAFERFEREWSPDELVRCKDCKNACVYCEESVICSHVDSHGNDVHSADWYCADGERI